MLVDYSGRLGEQALMLIAVVGVNMRGVLVNGRCRDGWSAGLFVVWT